MLPFKALDAVSATGAGSARDLETVAHNFTLHLLTTGAPSTVNVELQGSLDGANWYNLVSVSASDAVETAGFADGLAGGKRGARYVRGNLTSFNGGTSPTATLWVGVGE